MRSAPVTIFVDRPLGRLPGNGITNHWQRIDRLATQHASKGIQQLLHPSGLGTERVSRKGIVQPPALNVFQTPTGERQIRRIGVQNHQLAIEQDIGVRR